MTEVATPLNVVTASVSMSASTFITTGYVKMILQGGPLDGEQSLVQDLPRTYGSILTFNVPNYQVFAPDGVTLLALGLQVQYKLTAQGPSPNPGPPNYDTWDSSWVFSFVSESYIQPPAPITPPVVPPGISPSVWMEGDTSMTVNADDPWPGVNMLDTESDLDVEADTQTVGWSSVSMTDTVTTLNAMPVDWSTYGVALEGDTTMVLYGAEGIVTNMLSAQDSDLEGAGVGDWAGANANLGNASTGHTGTHSLGLTAVATGDMYARLPHATSGLTCVSGQSYVCSAYFRPASTVRSVIAAIQWFDINNNPISTSTSPIAEVSAQWVWAVTAAPAPANAVTMDVWLYVYGATAGETHYVDTISIGSTTTLS